MAITNAATSAWYPRPYHSMLRAAIVVLLLALAAVVWLPFLVSSLYIDKRGITIPGHVYSKREDVTLIYSAWKRSSEVTVEYSKPDGSGVGFLVAQLSPAEYDAMPVGQAANLHYLRPEDLPDVPLAKTLRRAQLLPTVRLAKQRTDSALAWIYDGPEKAMAVGVAVLLLWRLARIPGFWWAAGVCAAAVVVAGYFDEFPRPLQPPSVALRQGVGRVKSLARMDKLFSAPKSRGIDAAQPIDVVGVEFIPAGRTESVLAVDLIDAGSVPGLTENAAVPVEYESQTPRTAYIRGATRQFAAKNIAGIGWQGVACVVVFVVLVGAGYLLRQGYLRLVARSQT